MSSQQNRRLFVQWVKSLIKPAWAPSVVFVIHAVAFSFFQIYEAYPRFDIPEHFFGGVAMAYFLSKAFVSGSVIITGRGRNRLTQNLLTFTSTCTVAVFWEFAEFVLTWALSVPLQGDLADTMKDLFFGATGSLCYIAAVSLPIHMTSRLLTWGELDRTTLTPEE